MAPVVRHPYWSAFVPAVVMVAAMAVLLAVPVLRAEVNAFGVVAVGVGRAGALAGLVSVWTPAIILAALVAGLYLVVDGHPPCCPGLVAAGTR